MAPLAPVVLAAALALALPLHGAALILPQPVVACKVPDVAPGQVRVDAGPSEAVRIRFALADATEDTLQVWFALKASAANVAWPSERALAAGFLEDTQGALLAIVSPQLGIYPYGVQADAGPADLRVAAADGACWGAFGATRAVSLAAGDYDFVVVGASEAGSEFAAFLPAGAELVEVAQGPARLLSAATLDCPAKARAFASGLLAEAIVDCATSLAAEGRAYRSLVATWGPSDVHDVRWLDPAGAPVRCYKAPNWCVDTAAGAPGAWTLDVARHVTVRQPTVLLPGGVDYSGLFGVFAGRP
ncbi:MAG TPA: hypothetical protein VGR28_13175 [Candidatus Thermoplasmatota archaeon]|jgi:hypothetical protein|nr:hypothetical protein [Candidatus Thermoplasmatota archaeon]